MLEKMKPIIAEQLNVIEQGSSREQNSKEILGQVP